MFLMVVSLAALLKIRTLTTEHGQEITCKRPNSLTKIAGRKGGRGLCAQAAKVICIARKHHPLRRVFAADLAAQPD
jgi:hypothetical protein